MKRNPNTVFMTKEQERKAVKQGTALLTVFGSVLLAALCFLGWAIFGPIESAHGHDGQQLRFFPDHHIDESGIAGVTVMPDDGHSRVPPLIYPDWDPRLPPVFQPRFFEPRFIVVEGRFVMDTWCWWIWFWWMINPLR